MQNRARLRPGQSALGGFQRAMQKGRDMDKVTSTSTYYEFVQKFSDSGRADPVVFVVYSCGCL